MMPTNTRRWPRHEVDLPIGVVLDDGSSRTLVPGRGTEISEGGMSVYAAIDLKPFDLMEVEFEQPSRTQITAVVRNRSAYCFGVEFLTPLGGDESSRQPMALQKTPQPRLLTPEAAKIFERLRAANGNAAAYALLARVLQAAGWPEQAQKAADRAIAFFLQTKDAYLRQKELDIERTRREIAVLRKVRPLLAEGQEHIGPELAELISSLPEILGRK